MVWIVASGLGLLAAGVIYLRPTMSAPPAASTRAVHAVPAVSTRMGSAAFVDAEQGIVQVATVQSSAFGPGLAGFYVTSDGGRTWRLALRQPSNGVAWATFIDPHTMLEQEAPLVPPPGGSAGSPFGLATTRVSDDSGRTWRNLTDPRTNKIYVRPFFIDARHGWWVDQPPSQFVLGGSGSSGRPASPPVILWRTSDGGRSWERANPAHLPQEGVVVAVVFSTPRQGVLVSVSPATGGGAAYSILATADGGDSWRPVETPQVNAPDLPLTGMTVTRQGQRLIAFILMSESRSGVSRPTDLIERSVFVSVSEDGGQTWSQPRAGPSTIQPAYLYSRPGIDDRGRLLMMDGHRLWISEDAGLSWIARVIQAPYGLVPVEVVGGGRGTLYAVALEGGIGDITTLASRQTVIRSADGGTHWSTVALPILDPHLRRV